MIKRYWIAPRSPLSLIQEDVAYSEWILLVTCVMFNFTTRKQVEKILPRFIDICPTPQACLSTKKDLILETIVSLGFGRRRTVCLCQLAQALIDKKWIHALELPGIGEYGARSFEIFCLGMLGNSSPKDHALQRYYEWACVNWA
jgi:endonuclease III